MLKAKAFNSDGGLACGAITNDDGSSETLALDLKSPNNGSLKIIGMSHTANRHYWDRVNEILKPENPILIEGIYKDPNIEMCEIARALEDYLRKLTLNRRHISRKTTSILEQDQGLQLPKQSGRVINADMSYQEMADYLRQNGFGHTEYASLACALHYHELWRCGEIIGDGLILEARNNKVLSHIGALENESKPIQITWGADHTEGLVKGLVEKGWKIVHDSLEILTAYTSEDHQEAYA